MIFADELDVLYIKRPTGLQPTPQEIELSKAFCVRFHACLEDYFEQIAINMLALAKDKIDSGVFLSPTDLTDLTTANTKVQTLVEMYILMLHFAELKKDKVDAVKKLDEGIKNFSTEIPFAHKNATLLPTLKTTNDYTNLIFDAVNAKYSNDFRVSNHGASSKYLINMLLPMGININKDLRLHESLQSIVYYRGDYAHLGVNSKINTILSDTTLKEWKNDCLALCDDIRIQANARC